MQNTQGHDKNSKTHVTFMNNKRCIVILYPPYRGGEESQRKRKTKFLSVEEREAIPSLFLLKPVKTTDP